MKAWLLDRIQVFWCTLAGHPSRMATTWSERDRNMAAIHMAEWQRHAHERGESVTVAVGCLCGKTFVAPDHLGRLSRHD